MELRFRHKGLQRLYHDDDARKVPSEMVDKLRKQLLALETADGPSSAQAVSGLEAASPQGQSEGTLEPHRHWKLATGIQVRRTDEHRQ